METPPGTVKVLIADDHAMVREGLQKILSMEPRIKVIGEAKDGNEAVEKALASEVCTVLMDINMPGLNGIAACRIIKREKPDIHIIALTIHDQEEYLFEMVKAGASGYVLKDVNPDKLIETILGVANGESFLPPKLTANLLKEFQRLSSSEGQAPDDELTEREQEVLRLVAKGHTNKVIAENLYISEKTVKNHLTNIFQKLDVHDRTQAAILAIKSGMVKP
ncbi:MAG TPA: response regulator transcription factor [Clostridia bacterium]|nr:response regulator transcription factor [Clostridia bacterium]